MAEYRQVHTKIWDDDWFVELSNEEKIFFIWLITNRRASVSGLYEFSFRVVSVETGLPRKDVEGMVVKFSSEGKIVIRDGWIWVVNLRKYNDSNSPNSNKRIINDLRLVPEQLRIEYEDYYKDMVSPYKVATKGLGSCHVNMNMNKKKNMNMNTETEREKEGEDEKDARARKTSTTSAAYESLSENCRLYKDITGTYPTLKQQEVIEYSIALLRDTKYFADHPFDLPRYLQNVFEVWLNTQNKSGAYYQASNPGWLDWSVDLDRLREWVSKLAEARA